MPEERCRADRVQRKGYPAILWTFKENILGIFMQNSRHMILEPVYLQTLIDARKSGHNVC